MELAVESVGKDIVGSGSKPSKVQLKSCHVCYKSPSCKVHCTSGAPTTGYIRYEGPFFIDHSSYR